jgi:hypothetical protein
MATPAKKPSPEQVEKLAEGYRYVTVPTTDLYDKPVDSFWRNNREFKPGTHLLSPEDADYLEDRLKVWGDQMIGLMRPGVNKAVAKIMDKQGVHLTRPVEADPAYHG